MFIIYILNKNIFLIFRAFIVLKLKTNIFIIDNYLFSHLL